MKKIKLITTLTSLGTIAASTPVIVTGCSSTQQDFKTISYKGFGTPYQIYPNNETPIELETSLEAVDFKASDFIVTLEEGEEGSSVDWVSATSNNKDVVTATDAEDNSKFSLATTSTAGNAEVTITVKDTVNNKQGTAVVKITTKAATTPVIQCTKATIGGKGATVKNGDTLPYDLVKNDTMSFTLTNMVGANPTWSIDIASGATFNPTSGESTLLTFNDVSAIAANTTYTVTAKISDSSSYTFKFTTKTAAAKSDVLIQSGTNYTWTSGTSTLQLDRKTAGSSTPINVIIKLDPAKTGASFELWP